MIMKRMEFEARPSLDDCHKMVLAYEWVTGMFKVYAIIICIALIAHLVLCYLAFIFRWESLRDKAVLIFPMIVFVLILKLALNVGIARQRYVNWTKRDEKPVLYFDSTGFGQVSYRNTLRIREIFYAWEEFHSIYETKDFLFLKPRGSPAISISKRVFSDDNVTAIRKLLADTHVKKMRLL
jgi:hypothetical protein